MHETDELITLTEAAKQTPGRPTPSCIWRWCRNGVLSRQGQRIRLKHARIGGKLFTSSLWLSEFGQQMAQADAEYFDSIQPPGGPTRRRRPLNRNQQQREAHLDRVRQELEAAGI